MKIRTKLLLIVLLMCLPLLLNLWLITILRRDTIAAVERVQAVAVRQQAITLQLQARLRNAEAALYRYQIEGDERQIAEFHNWLAQFAAAIVEFRQLAVTPVETSWIGELEAAHADAVQLGNALITLRNNQTNTLLQLENSYNDALSLLIRMRLANPTDNVYQRIINDMLTDLRNIFLAVTAYLTMPSAAVQFQLSEAAIAFRYHHSQFDRKLTTPIKAQWAAELRDYFEQITDLAEVLIADQSVQQQQLAQFTANHYYIGREVIVGQIQPYESQSLATAQAELIRSLTAALSWSLFIAGLTVVGAFVLVMPFVRSVRSSIHTLQAAANRIADGELTQPVTLPTDDELAQLGRAFNSMMRELASRQQGLQLRIRELELLRQKLGVVQEEERRLVGLDLHDGLMQILLSANMHLNTMAAMVDDLTPAASRELQTACDRLRDAIAEVRWVVAELRPTELEDYALAEGLRHYVNKIAARTQWAVEFRADLLPIDLAPATETAVFRIVQEALSNAHKHAQTERIHIALCHAAGRLSVTVQDWGNGFDQTLVGDDEHHLGLLGMQERAALVGGDVAIHSRRGVGTTITVTIPGKELCCEHGAVYA